MIVDFLEQLGVWNWFLLGIVLLCIELVAPGTFMLWFGVAALAVGVLSLLVDWSWQLQVVAFGVLAILSVGLSRQLMRSRHAKSDTPFLNQRAEAIVGRGFVLDEPIVNGRGRLSVDDTIWRVEGPDLPAGTPVTVLGASGSLLRVEKADGAV